MGKAHVKSPSLGISFNGKKELWILLSPLESSLSHGAGKASSSPQLLCPARALVWSVVDGETLCTVEIGCVMMLNRGQC